MGEGRPQTPDIYCVRANHGEFAEHCLKGGYIGIGWLAEYDLLKVRTREELEDYYKKAYPDQTSRNVIGQQVGQIRRFLLEIKPGDYIVLPPVNTNYLHYGVVDDEPYGYYSEPSDGCPYKHRRKVAWHKEAIRRDEFSVPFQNSMRSSLTVFKITHQETFFTVIGKSELVPQTDTVVEGGKKRGVGYYDSVLSKILELDDKEFEILITHILNSQGFEDVQNTGGPGDGGIDATGEFSKANMIKVPVFVQVKRYDLEKQINVKQVKDLRANIPNGGQGVFVTTSDYQKKAKDIAVEDNFPRIGLVNGKQLVDLLSESWEDIPDDFKEKLNLRVGLVHD